MLELTLRYPASALAGKQRLTQDDALMLRGRMFVSGLVSEADAWLLLALHKSSPEKSPQWSRWFVEAMADFFVNGGYAENFLDADDADCLLAMIAPDAVIRDNDELELLLHVMELSRDCPDILSALALDQLRLALATGEGAYAAQRSCKRAGVSIEDLDYVYRIVRGKLDHGRLRLTQREAEALERIDTIVSDRLNHPGWRRLIDSVAVTGECGSHSRGWLRLDEAGLPALEEAA
ncbi:hypothetical protein M2360_005251 [Rhizobium sp. SG_E_25_P2]|uniref:hypothetical protein n=1 Tax=Rhizobium sp. SG_E_25_P2 TaxID=2879942 RepID=UPI002475348A|nr:hypothetical protein [Rhizobium sp. SG_E_25_P2]MDH6269819.1 hypothetical protein [Rhizobium sp. SG_E_25_P2]